MVAYFTFMTLLIVSCATYNAKVIESFIKCGSDGWFCDDNQTEAIYDCKEIPEGTRDFAEYKVHPNDERLSTSTTSWKKDVPNKTQKLVYKNCFGLIISSQLNDEEVDSSLAVRNVAYLRFDIQKETSSEKVKGSSEDEVCRHWPTHLELKNIGSFSTSLTDALQHQHGSMKEASYENVRVTSPILVGYVENGSVSMVNVTFNAVNLDVWKGQFRMENSHVKSCEGFQKRISVKADVLVLEGNTMDVLGTNCLDLRAYHVLISKNRFNYLHPRVFSKVYPGNLRQVPSQFVFSNNHITELAESALDLPDNPKFRSSPSFSDFKIENNTVDCACRNKKFFEMIVRRDLPLKQRIFYKDFADKNYCSGNAKCKNMKISSIKNINALCTNKGPVTNSGC